MVEPSGRIPMPRSPIGTPPPAVCKRCKTNEVTIKMRADDVCQNCFASFVHNKIIKRMEVLNRETRSSKAPTLRTLLIGLSFGPSSTTMLNILNDAAQRHAATKRRGGVRYLAVHVDTTLSSDTKDAKQQMEKYQKRYSDVQMHIAPLSDVVGLNSIDWAALPRRNPDLPPAQQLQEIFDNLPSITSQADVLRLFVRHILIDKAIRTSCSALLLGHTTTALAETTLAEAAKGRGFAIPWLIDDGQFPTLDSQTIGDGQEEGLVAETNILSVEDDTVLTTARSTASLPIYYPMRDVFRREVNIYIKTIEPPLTNLVINPERPEKVVSHKDISIEEVMLRYFEEVEENYPSVVANVVRASTKLDKTDINNGARCSLCRLSLDETGNQRWKGEIGAVGPQSSVDEGGVTLKLCYGCERSVKG